MKTFSGTVSFWPPRAILVGSPLLSTESEDVLRRDDMHVRSAHKGRTAGRNCSYSTPAVSHTYIAWLVTPTYVRSRCLQAAGICASFAELAGPTTDQVTNANKT